MGLPAISIHAPQWGATGGRRHVRPEGHISIHAPQWGATDGNVWRIADELISIHAPQWGATEDVGDDAVDDIISIHAPQWGATTPTTGTPTDPALFQSTHPSGVRLGPSAPRPIGSDFNPRTPVGCDGGDMGLYAHQPYFNPRTPVGCDLPAGVENRPAKRFQSTHPSGVRHGILTWPVTGVRISIHAPQWGAT